MRARLVRQGLGAFLLLVACDAAASPQAPPLDPRPSPSAGGGVACPKPAVDGAAVTLFEWEGSCLPGDGMVLYRCSSTADPVLRLSSTAGPVEFLGGTFAVPVSTLPANVRFAGAADATEVLIADPVPPSPEPGASSALTPSPTAEPAPEPLVYVRRDGITERWLPLERGRALGETPSAWLIGDSILDGGREAVEASLAGWTVTVDAQVGRPSSGAVAPAGTAAELGADAVLVEVGTNDSSVDAFRSHVVEILDLLRGVPLVIWQTARGPVEEPAIPGVNAAIREIVQTYPNVAIADWEAFVPEEAVQTDGIHPDEGYEHLESDLVSPLLVAWWNATTGRGATACRADVKRAT